MSGWPLYLQQQCVLRDPRAPTACPTSRGSLGCSLLRHHVPLHQEEPGPAGPGRCEDSGGSGSAVRCPRALTCSAPQEAADWRRWTRLFPALQAAQPWGHALLHPICLKVPVNPDSPIHRQAPCPATQVLTSKAVSQGLFTQPDTSPCERRENSGPRGTQPPLYDLAKALRPLASARTPGFCPDPCLTVGLPKAQLLSPGCLP